MLFVPIVVCALFGTFAEGLADTRTATFAVMRNDDRIGTNTIDVENNGLQTSVQTVTHVEVKVLFLTVYRFDQTETERWTNGHPRFTR